MKQADSSFKSVELAPPDKVFHTATLFRQDKNPNKLNLGIGAYRTADGYPYVLPVVQEVEQQLTDYSGKGFNSHNVERIHPIDTMANFVIEACCDRGLNKEYLPIKGMSEFIKLSQILILGEDCTALKENRVAGVQTLSGTGALRICSDFIHQNLPGRAVFYSNPTQANHRQIFQAANLQIGKPYRYQNESTRSIDFDGMFEDIDSYPDGSIILLQACAHNPTGIDPTCEQWQKLAQLMKKKKHLPIFDCAYQGYASGNLDKDAYAVRLFEKEGLDMFIAQSYSKNMGLYGERVGCASIVSNICNKDALESRMAKICRASYSNPPIHGARIVTAILGNFINYQKWVKQLSEMSQRIILMREKLFTLLNQNKVPGTQNHIVEQIGMFSYTGLTTDQVTKLRERFHIYMLDSGRISMAGLNESTCQYLADAIYNVITCPEQKTDKSSEITNIIGVSQEIIQNKEIVIVAIDQSESSKDALLFAINNFEDNFIVLCNVINEEKIGEFQKFIDERSLLCQRNDVKHAVYTINGEPSVRLVELSKQLNVNCLVIGSRNQNILKNLLIGSVSNYCLQNCDCPVLVVKEKHEV